MSNILTIAYTTEGSTDQRFLKPIILKVFEDVAFECAGTIEVFDPIFIKCPPKDSFVESIISVSIDAYESGINVLCVHVDADSNNDDHVTEFKIEPAQKGVNQLGGQTNCKNLVPIIPIHMSEAWMLADKELLKNEIGTYMSNSALGINRHPESIANPKKTIEEALNIAQAHLPKRRNKITIGDLYQPIGQKLKIEQLERLQSFKKFKSSVIESLKTLNYLN